LGCDITTVPHVSPGSFDCSVCGLPAHPISIRISNGFESHFNIELKNVGSGYDVYDGTWLGWCADTTIETNKWSSPFSPVKVDSLIITSSPLLHQFFF